MNNRFLIAIVFVFFLYSSSGQGALDDAITLSLYYKDNKLQEINKQGVVYKRLVSERDSLISLESPTYSDNSRLKQVKKIIKNEHQLPNKIAFYKIVNKYGLESGTNPFIQIPDGSLESNSKDIYQPEGLGFSENLGGNNIIFGLTDFLIERTKTELNTAFFKKFKEDLTSKDEYKDLSTLFPRTTALLEIIDTEIYQFDHYLNTLKVAFSTDLGDLLKNLPQVLENHEDALSDHPYLSEILSLGLDMAQWVKDDRHPGEILYLTAFHETADTLSRDTMYASYINGLQTVAFLSESLRSTDASNGYWINRSKLNALNDPIIFKIYLGLLYEECKKEPYNNIVFSNKAGKHTLLEVLNYIGNNINDKFFKRDLDKFRQFIIGVGTSAESVMKSVKNLRKVENELQNDTINTPREKRNKMLRASIKVFDDLMDLQEELFKLEKLPKVTISFSERDKQVVEYLHHLGMIANDVLYEDYTQAITNTVLFIDEILPDDVSQELQLVMKYGAFMASFVEAQSPEQAKQVIEAVALPPGSYTIKRESAFSVALNGYLGAFSGWEVIDGVETSSKMNNFALTAPIGISLSWGNMSKGCKRPWSLGVLIPIIDLGTVASYRFDASQDSTSIASSVPTINLKHLVAPGLFVELGIAGTPISLGFGGQIGPRLRNVDRMGNDISDMYWRCGASLKVDIPIFNFYAKPGKVNAEK